MLLGVRGGAIGEACILAIAVGFAYLVIRRVIKIELPLIFVTTVFLLSLLLTNDLVYSVYQILAGGLVFAAVFMITDYVTTPITRVGRMIFAVGCGIITALIRIFGSLPEGVSFSIIIMNILVPHIEHLTTARPFGEVKEKKKKKEAEAK
jgi:electron transport complex protein RnfD